MGKEKLRDWHFSYLYRLFIAHQGEVFIARPLGRGEQGRQFFIINKSRSRPISKEEYWLVKEGHPDAPVRRDILKVT